MGLEVGRTAPLVLRPSIGYRFGYLPGIALNCVADGSDYTCDADGPAELMVYGVGRVHSPMFEMSVDYLNRSRTTPVGIGVKAVVEQALGTLPKEAEATFDEGVVSYTVVQSGRFWTATGFRILLNVSVSF